MSLAAAAAAMGLPESLVERSAAARAAETGMSVDEILAAWAGGGAVPAAAPPASEAPADDPKPTEAAPPVESTAVPPTPAVDLQPAAPAAFAPPPPLTEVTPAQAANLPEVVTVPTAGIRERTSFRLPAWLFGLMLIIPVFALFALGGSATGTCGEATELTTDVVTGEIINCDGSEFTGSGIGGGTVDFVALGESIYTGAEIGAVNCAGCHGVNGGGGVGPALNAVLTVFGACTDHVEWIALGSPGFQAEGRQTYGDTDKPVAGGMPGFNSTLTEEQVAAVSAFERVRFGGGNSDEVLADCGLTGEEGGEGDGTGSTVPSDEDAASGEGDTASATPSAEAS